MAMDIAYLVHGIMSSRKEGKKRVFFWSNLVQNTIKSKASLQTCHKINPEINDKILKPIDKTDSKRTFSFSPLFMEASMCVEAALSFSFFLFFFINLFSIIFLFINYTKDLEKLQQRAKREASYAYPLTEQIMEEDIFRYRKELAAEPFSPLIGYGKGKVLINCVVKPWTGYKKTGQRLEKEEEMVYVTEHGEVYHKDRACTHLSLSIQMIAYEGIKTGGKKYHPCELCFNNYKINFTAIVYITNYGERYHRTTGCRSLKRTIKTIPLSEVRGKPVCLKCG